MLCRCPEQRWTVCSGATVSSALLLTASYTDRMCLTKAGETQIHKSLDETAIQKLKDLKDEASSKLTLVVHAAVLVLLAGHEGLDLGLGHLLSCGGTRNLRQGVGLQPSAPQRVLYSANLRLTQGGQHDAQLGAHDRAVALLVEDAQTLNVVVESRLVGAVDDALEHGKESLEINSLAGHVCVEKRETITVGSIRTSTSQEGLRQRSSRC